MPAIVAAGMFSTLQNHKNNMHHNTSASATQTELDIAKREAEYHREQAEKMLHANSRIGRMDQPCQSATISAAIGTLDTTSNVLHEIVVQLAEKLKPVINPHSDHGLSGKADCKPPETSPLYNELLSINGKYETAILHLRVIMNAIQL